MAEVAAGAWAAEEAVSTTVQAGVGAYYVAKPTLPLKATFNQVATSSDDETRLSLTRAHHSLCVVGNKAYIYGGETGAGKVASNDVHVVTLEQSGEKAEPEYAIVPPVADVQGNKLPQPRSKHAACAFNVCVAVFGGLDESGKTIENEASIIWLFNTAKSAWEKLQSYDREAGPRPRSGARIFNHRNHLVIYGGTDAKGKAMKDLWHFDYVKKYWTHLPDAPVSTSNAALIGGILYLVAPNDRMSSDLHFFSLDAPPDEDRKWQTVGFPHNPVTPGPLPRVEAGLAPISTGQGRNFLIYMLGARAPEQQPNAPADPYATMRSGGDQDPPRDYWSDTWAFQLPSTSAANQDPVTYAEMISPAYVKDSIRWALGYESGEHSWAEVEVMPPAGLESGEGKLHPGPRGSFAYDVMGDGKSVVMWGGVNAKGEIEGDGWIIRLD